MDTKCKALYIGINSEGTTSKMRAGILKKILSNWDFDIIDTDIHKKSMNRIWQSIGFRYKKGPLITKVNDYVLRNIQHDHYDLIWVDKAIYLSSKTTQFLKSHTDCLIHYTPDPAFTYHQSRHFYESLSAYDFVVTTKSFEIDSYKEAVMNGKVIYATQGFDKNLHKPLNNFEVKKGVCFIGHYEKTRAQIILNLLSNGVDVVLAGIKWERFVAQHKNNPHLKYLGNGVYGEDYVGTISKSLFGWGSVSKWIPEKHTTRTFEIPACGTALLTERNPELETFFNDDEVIFYDSEDEMIKKIIYYYNHLDELKILTNKGYERVVHDGRDYESIICNILRNCLNLIQ